MRHLFADTFWWIALASPTDQWHTVARRLVPSLVGVSLVTTEEVLSEFLAGMAGRGQYQRQLAVHMVRRILADSTVTVVPQTSGSFRNGFDLYANRLDKEYSLIDCISMNACRTEGITEILTHDHHFAQEGFTLLITA